MKFDPVERLMELAEYSHAVASLCQKTDLEQKMTDRERTMMEALEQISDQIIDLVRELAMNSESEEEG